MSQQNAASAAPLTLARIFGDHMVLQRDVPVRVWGRGQAGERLSVAFAGQAKSAVAGRDGKWSVVLDAMGACKQGRELAVTSAAAGRRAAVRDVLVGEVWIASGQSNVVMPLKGLPGAEAVVAAADSMAIRACYVNVEFAASPQDDLANKDYWDVCSRERINDYSGIGMFFAARLVQELDVPVGIVISAMGGSRIEAWTPREALAAAEPGRTFLINDRDRADIPPSQRTFFGIDGDQHLPSRLYNAMIAPLTPMGLRGVLWYQGESSALEPLRDAAFGRRGDAGDYGALLAGMMQSWRKAFGRDELAFVLVQLPRYNGDTWPLVREGQRVCALQPHTAMAVAIDTGEAENGHPLDKEPVATRAALSALGKIYGRKVEYEGPAFRKMSAEGSKATIEFDHAGSGLVVKGGKLEGFEAAGADGKFYPAQGTAAGNTVTLSCPQVAAIVSVRYAWAGVPKCSLYNSAGLPAGPFRLAPGTGRAGLPD
ncbi:MAG: sialate O-acetylesterase [Planctomycetaceae bacterium]|nr:sialate O-acetylesterase [Planctomycetaceae bacterium]